ncbi:hypothetical protein CRYUN_Cryun38cG0056700 [Craigia yunnanensis]
MGSMGCDWTGSVSQSSLQCTCELHTKAPSHGFSFTKKSVENAFGRKLTEIFANFEVEPLASGSFAQVH